MKFYFDFDWESPFILFNVKFSCMAPCHLWIGVIEWFATLKTDQIGKKSIFRRAESSIDGFIALDKARGMRHAFDWLGILPKSNVTHSLALFISRRRKQTIEKLHNFDLINLYFIFQTTNCHSETLQMGFLCACVGLIVDLHELYEEKQGKIRHKWELRGCCCQKVDENIFRLFWVFWLSCRKIFRKH